MDESYPSRYFTERAIWAETVSPLMNTVALGHQFKPIQIGENLVVNYNASTVTVYNHKTMYFF